jgi:hypothetical protein
MYSKMLKHIFTLTVGCLFQSITLAGQITYDLSNLGGSRWQYDYALNNTGSSSISEFTIYFDRNHYSNLVLIGTATAWDSIIVQADSGLSADGFLDALSLGDPLLTGGKVTGFSVSFDFRNANRPADQQFDFINPISFTSFFSGTTMLFVAPLPSAPPLPTSSVPGPSTAVLVLLTFLIFPYNYFSSYKQRLRGGSWKTMRILDTHHLTLQN